MAAGRAADHPLFLRWALINALLAIFLVTAGAAYRGNLHGAVLVALPIILAIYCSATYYAGKLAWRADDYLDTVRGSEPERIRILHDAEWINRWAYSCQIAGIMCTMAGFFVILSKSGTQADLTSKLAGGSVALLGSFVGVLCSLVLLLQHWLIEHALDG